MEHQIDETKAKEWLHYAIALYNDDKNDYEVREGLIARGVPEEWAEEIQTRALDSFETSEKKGGSSAMILGAGLFLLGVLLTFVVSIRGGGVQIFYGLMVVGLVTFVRGIGQKLS
jgi:uncharacterized membrane-anchored protein